MTFLHQHTVLYTNILEKNQEIKNILIKHKQSDKPDDKDKKKSKDNKDKEKEKDKDKDQKEGEPEIEYERVYSIKLIKSRLNLLTPSDSGSNFKMPSTV